MTEDEKLEYAYRVLQMAKRLLQQHGLGATIIVHDAVLDPDTLGRPVVATSLPNTGLERIVLATVTVGLAMIDGGTAENTADLVDRDIAALRAGQL